MYVESYPYSNSLECPKTKPRTTDAQRGNSLHCTAENSIPIPNFYVRPKHILSATSAQFFRYLWFMPSLGVRSSCINQSHLVFKIVFSDWSKFREISKIRIGKAMSWTAQNLPLWSCLCTIFLLLSSCFLEVISFLMSGANFISWGFLTSLLSLEMKLNIIMQKRLT